MARCCPGPEVIQLYYTLSPARPTLQNRTSKLKTKSLHQSLLKTWKKLKRLEWANQTSGCCDLLFPQNLMYIFSLRSLETSICRIWLKQNICEYCRIQNVCDMKNSWILESGNLRAWNSPDFFLLQRPRAVQWCSKFGLKMGLSFRKN